MHSQCTQKTCWTVSMNPVMAKTVSQPFMLSAEMYNLILCSCNPILSPQGSHLPPCSPLLKIPFISLSLASEIFGKDMLVVSTVTLRHRTNKIEESRLVF